MRFDPTLLLRILLPVLIATMAVSGCNRSPNSENTGKHYPEKAGSDGIIRHATGFQVTGKGEYRLLSIRNPFNGDTARYLLVKDEMNVPKDRPGTLVLRVPLRRIAVTSGLFAGAAEQLEALDFLVATGSGDKLYSKQIRERIAYGRIAEITEDGKLDEKKLLAQKPDVILMSGMDARDKVYPELVKAGIPVIHTFSEMEDTPLGQAEWIKLLAALLDRQNFSDHQFAFVEYGYQSLADRVAGFSESRTSVLPGSLMSDSWILPGGKSITAKLLEDAGAAYHWSNNTDTGVISPDKEVVYPVALTADVWLYTGPVADKKELLASDSAYVHFKSVKSNRLYSLTNRIATNGANDYDESAPFRPDLVLADYIHILYPDLLPGHLLYYGKQLK